VQRVKRAVKIVIGFTLLAFGIVLLVTPGPGWLVILSGLAVLAAEFIWARRLLERLKSAPGRVVNALRPGGNAPSSTGS
jgi:uncharacterized protein (TIGR02611 family)